PAGARGVESGKTARARQSQPPFGGVGPVREGPGEPERRKSRQAGGRETVAMAEVAQMMGGIVPAISPADTKTSVNLRDPRYQELKSRIHEGLLARLNLERLTQTKREDAEPEIRSLISEMLEFEGQGVPPGAVERESLVSDVLNELFGLGPLEVLLRDSTVSD